MIFWLNSHPGWNTFAFCQMGCVKNVFFFLYLVQRCDLVLAGIELIFLPVAAVVWIYYEKNVDNRLMFSVVAKKPRTFSSLPFFR